MCNQFEKKLDKVLKLRTSMEESLAALGTKGDR